ncbi:two-component sensor histidine kinase [Enterococcus florum]|uniref:histidine kinase n=1 Tax=Enterococcus florum TaxID=2480627 RepID=A0A4P5PCA3_9ENTE|nr:HAMP domain-containing sensor histidine kinase [Enterococcus florum]GCF93062.1 two-component sensor histidine kinase [Enterococcus florum]
MFRNKELRRFAGGYVLLAIILSALGFRLGTAAGILVMSSAAVFAVLFYWFTRRRYQHINRLSAKIDLVLHDADRLMIQESDEGELAILQSEITKMTRRIREQNEALKREKERLAEAMADIAHQLRTPLTSANLTLSLISSTAEAQQRQLFVRETEELLNRMDWLLTALLNLSRLDAGVVQFKKEEIEVKVLVQAALRPLLIPLELRDVTVKQTIAESVQVQGDRGWLTEALQNVLKNCLENAEEKGTIEIVCRDTPLFVEISIHDDGPGFDASDLPHLFERFYRGKPSETAGYGIGLSLSKSIIKQQNGTIRARNHPKGGAVFLLQFPK